MKKNRMSFMLVAVAILLGICISAQAVIKRGDVNGDGVVDARDIVAIVKTMMGNASEVFESRADVNHDNKVNVADVIELYKIINGSKTLEDDVTTLLTQPRTGAYEGLYYESANPTDMFYFISCLASDEMLGGGGSADKTFHQIDLLDYNPTEAWDNYQTYISNTNDVIKKLEKLQETYDEDCVRHGLGEAHFLRAYYSYEMASLYDNMPVITDNDSWEQKMTVSTPADVWGQILLDLKQAITLMDGYSPTLKTDDSRVGKYAAEAMLARAYLFYTGFYLDVNDIASASDVTVDLPDGSKLAKADVIAYIEDCVKNSGFKLVSDYRNLWPYTNRLTVEDYSYTQGQNLKWVEDDGEVNPEVLFKIKYNTKASWSSTVGYSNTQALFYGVRIGGNRESHFPFGQGWGAGPVSPGLYSEWTEAEPNDIRINASVFDMSNTGYSTEYSYVQETPYHEAKISAIACMYEDQYQETFEKIMYADGIWDASGNFMQLGNIHPLNLIRLADVLLMHSELTGTVEGINQVRKRAGLSEIGSYSLEALQQERRWELAFEGVRWNDMRRWGDEYCKTALDKQMNQPIKNDGVQALNPQGVADLGFESYSANYAKNRGFFAAPAEAAETGGAALENMQGAWMLNEMALAGCYGTLQYEHTAISAFLEDPSANGLTKRYTREEMKSLPGDKDKGELGALAYIDIQGSEIMKYNASGELLAKSEISITLTDNFDWRICTMTVDGKALFNGTSGQTQIDIVSLDADRGVMMLVDATNATKDGEAVYWSLRRPSYEEINARWAHGVKWSYALSEGTDWTGNFTSVGTWGLVSYDFQNQTGNGSVPTLYAPHVESVKPENLQSVLESLGIDTSNGEADPFAYMVIDLNEETISRYTRDDKLISSGPVSIYSEGTYIKVTASETGNILIPYSYHEKGKKMDTYYLRCNRQTANFPNYAALAIRSVDSYENYISDYWLFAYRGLTSEELDSRLVLKRTNTNGEVDDEGCYISYNIGDDALKPAISCTDGTAVVYNEKTNTYKVNIPYGETAVKTVRFTIFNANGINAVAERELKFVNNDPLPAELLLLAGQNGSKKWTWDTSITGAVWGNMGYMPGSGESVALQGNGQWWGITSEAEFETVLHHTNDGVLHGDESMDATMVFQINGTVKCYDANGGEIRNGSYGITDYNASNPEAYLVGYLNTTPGAILWPYEINSGGNMPTKFDLVYLSDTKFCLVYPDGGEGGSWSEATFWHFKAK